MIALDRIKKIGERWFLTEPLLFAVYCSHEFVENNAIDVPMRTGNMKVEFSPKVLDKIADDVLTEYLKVEMFRILLKHPYQRQPPFAVKSLLTCASNITIADVYDVSREVKKQMSGTELKLPRGLCFEEYYNLLKQKSMPAGGTAGEPQQTDGGAGQGEDEQGENGGGDNGQDGESGGGGASSNSQGGSGGNGGGNKSGKGGQSHADRDTQVS